MVKSQYSLHTSVVIPVFNEIESIGSLLGSLVKLGAERGWEIILVDDGSSDGTAIVIEPYVHPPDVILIHHPRNRGYGAALKTGIRQAQGELVVTMDADGQHDPAQLGELLAQAEGVDMVVGQRMGIIHSPLWRMPGKWLLGWLANYLTRQNIPDLNSGMRVMRRDIISKYLHLCPDGFSFSTTITLLLFNRGYSIKYVPISVRHRQGKSSVSVTTGLETLLLILRIISLLDPLRLFLPVSLALLVLGFLWGIPYTLQGGGVSVGALLLLLSGLLTFFFGLMMDQISQLRKERFE